MNAMMDELHERDLEGNVTGGLTTGIGLTIQWQDGPLEGGEQTGAQVDDVLEAALGRLRAFQETGFKCRENAIAITKIEEALMWQQRRTAGRVERGVEGKNEP